MSVYLCKDLPTLITESLLLKGKPPSINGGHFKGQIQPYLTFKMSSIHSQPAHDRSTWRYRWRSMPSCGLITGS